MFWILNIYLVLHDLLASYTLNWITSHIIIYADDINLRWIVISMPAGFEALQDLYFVLCTLKAYHFQMNESKSVTIMRLVGKSVQVFWKTMDLQTKRRVTPAFPRHCP